MPITVEGLHVRRPSVTRWDSSNPEEPFIVKSNAHKGRLLRVWRTDGYTGKIPQSDWQVIVNTAWSIGKLHHVQNHHSYGYTRYDLEVVELPRIPEEPVDTFCREPT